MIEYCAFGVVGVAGDHRGTLRLNNFFGPFGARNVWRSAAYYCSIPTQCTPNLLGLSLTQRDIPSYHGRMKCKLTTKFIEAQKPDPAKRRDVRGCFDAGPRPACQHVRQQDVLPAQARQPTDAPGNHRALSGPVAGGGARAGRVSCSTRSRRAGSRSARAWRSKPSRRSVR